jgi:hypothetical protein
MSVWQRNDRDSHLARYQLQLDCRCRGESVLEPTKHPATLVAMRDAVPPFDPDKTRVERREQLSHLSGTPRTLGDS